MHINIGSFSFTNRYILLFLSKKCVNFDRFNGMLCMLIFTLLLNICCEKFKVGWYFSLSLWLKTGCLLSFSQAVRDFKIVFSNSIHTYTTIQKGVKHSNTFKYRTTMFRIDFVSQRSIKFVVMERKQRKWPCLTSAVLRRPTINCQNLIKISLGFEKFSRCPLKRQMFRCT